MATMTLSPLVGACGIAPGHEHGPTCGHATFLHDDHVDYLVGTTLHHCTRQDEACVVHGTVHAVTTSDICMTVVPEATASLRRRNIVPTTREPDAEALVAAAASAPHPSDTSVRFTIGFALTASFMVIEFVVGVLINSLALQADAFHMASDVISMGVGWYAAAKAGKPRTDRSTYGFRRLEIVGALINCVFLLSICFTITVDAAQRFAQYAQIAEEIAAEVNMLLIVGGVGLGINIIGLFVFSVGQGGHGHSHGGHGHSHGDGSAHRGSGDGGHAHSHGSGQQHAQSRVSVVSPSAVDVGSRGLALTGRAVEEELRETSVAPRLPRWNLNIQGVLLHVAGDALGSVAVIVSGLFVKYFTSPLRGLADPLCSLFIVLLLAYGSVSPLRRAVAILTQKVPLTVDVARLAAQLRDVQHVLSVHDLHVWQLDEQRPIGTVHLVISSAAQRYYELLDRAKSIFHAAGVHATTVQLEFHDQSSPNIVPAVGAAEGGACFDPLCGQTCEGSHCCPSSAQPPA